MLKEAGRWWRVVQEWMSKAAERLWGAAGG